MGPRGHRSQTTANPRVTAAQVSAEHTLRLRPRAQLVVARAVSFKRLLGCSAPSVIRRKTCGGPAEAPSFTGSPHELETPNERGYRQQDEGDGHQPEGLDA